MGNHPSHHKMGNQHIKQKKERLREQEQYRSLPGKNIEDAATELDGLVDSFGKLTQQMVEKKCFKL